MCKPPLACSPRRDWTFPPWSAAPTGRRWTPLPGRSRDKGKHSGFLCLACTLSGGGELRQFAKGYVQSDHAVMREVTAALQAVTGFDPSTAPRGTDGCSIPTFGIPLRRLALAFARIGTGVGLRAGHALAAQRLRRAIAAAPFMVAGSARFDTRVMERLGQRVCCKVGAEGVFCAALPERGLGVAIKIDDGNNARAAEVAMAAVIEACLSLTGADAAGLHALSHPRLHNWNGIEVGRLRPASALLDLRLR
jgi:L-asparaginase II